MKILFDTTDFSTTAVLWRSQFEKVVGNYADCKYVGPYWPDHIKGEPLIKSIKRVYGRREEPDWVLGSLSRIPKKRNFRAGVFLSDIHRDPKQLVKDVNNAGIDVIFMRAPLVMGRLYAKYSVSPKFFLKSFNGKVIFLPFSVDANYFKPSAKKKWDVCFIGGARSGPYPIRHNIKNNLAEFCTANNLSFVRGGRPHGFKVNGFLPKYYKNPPPGVYLGKHYASVLAKSKIFLFDSSIMKYPVKKYFEGMSSGILCLADEPMMAKKLHFVDGYNYVNINIDNWQDKVLFYLKHEADRKYISANGRKTIEEYHTHDVRAKMLVAELKALM